jgi:hypothetical protein
MNLYSLYEPGRAHGNKAPKQKQEQQHHMYICKGRGGAKVVQLQLHPDNS